MNDIVKWLRTTNPCGMSYQQDAADEIERLRAELERERLRLAACGVVALADTPESAINARAMHDDYKSASCDDVARRVDECMRLRAELAAEKQANTELQLALGAKDYDLIEVRGELAAAKALLREASPWVGYWDRSEDAVYLYKRILEELGDNTTS